MNIEAYDVESLRKLVRLLEYENKRLKERLKKENILYDDVKPFEETVDHMETYDPDQGGRITAPAFITEEMAKRFFLCFEKLCLKQCGEKILCDECENTKWIKLDVKKIIALL